MIVIDEAHHALAETYRELWKSYPEARKMCIRDRVSITEQSVSLILSKEKIIMKQYRFEMCIRDRYPILSFPFILKGILKRERWAYLLGAILMGYIGMLRCV